jgi:hypothetical protein
MRVMNADIYYSAASREDFPAILELQGKNLFETLTSEQRASGFLTGEFSIDMLQEIINGAAIVKAFTTTELVGYRMAQTLAFASNSPLLSAIIERFPRIAFGGQKLSELEAFISGPACIAEVWRGKGIHEGMFKKMLSLVQNRFDIGVGFVDEANSRSLAAAQRKLGMHLVDRLAFNGKAYSILVFPTKEEKQNPP